MSKNTTTKPKQTVTQKIASYLSGRKTPATKVQIVKQVNANSASIKRNISYMIKAGTVTSTPSNAKRTGRGRPTQSFTTA